jgi:hypothetical protein
MKSREGWLELGLASFALAIAGAAGLVAFGRAAESARRRRRHAQPPPEPGTVPARSHHNIAGCAAR